MDYKSKNEIGNIEISEDVICSIAYLATLEVEGVAGMFSGFTSNIYDKISKKNEFRGVKIIRNNDEVIINLFVIVDFGLHIQKVSLNIQKRVKKAIEVMTGLNVIQININVEAVNAKINE